MKTLRDYRTLDEACRMIARVPDVPQKPEIVRKAEIEIETACRLGEITVEEKMKLWYALHVLPDMAT